MFAEFKKEIKFPSKKSSGCQHMVTKIIINK